MVTLKCLGAAGTVTGSKHLVEVGDFKILVDCGLFQGLKHLRLKNWEPLPIDAREIDVIVLTHAHLDHTGFLPRVYKQGFRGRIVATEATVDLTGVILRDSGKLQEEEAAFHNRHGSSKHHPAEPLYTIEDAEAVSQVIEGFPFGQKIELAPGIAIEYRPAGHILGSATVSLEVESGGEPWRMAFSGDIGVWDSPLLAQPAPIGPADYVMLESTYGDRLHSNESIEDQLERLVKDAIKRGGAMIVPAFAVARSQVLVYYLGKLQAAGRIPVLPIYLDSPMAVDATDIYLKHPADLRPEIRGRLREVLGLENLHIVRSRDESQRINGQRGPMIIVSASGMATGGRVLHHLLHRVSRPETTLLFAGFQAEGTRGWRLQHGERSVRIFGEDVPVRAAIETVHGLSAHGDQGELLRWLATVEGKPKKVFLVHGEPNAIDVLATKIRQDLGFDAVAPAEDQKFYLE
jgi:metallo-beta-lactamase family protein